MKPGAVKSEPPRRPLVPLLAAVGVGAGVLGVPLDLVDPAELARQAPTVVLLYLWLTGTFVPTVRLAQSGD